MNHKENTEFSDQKGTQTPTQSSNKKEKKNTSVRKKTKKMKTDSSRDASANKNYNDDSSLKNNQDITKDYPQETDKNEGMSEKEFSPEGETILDSVAPVLWDEIDEDNIKISQQENTFTNSEDKQAEKPKRKTKRKKEETKSIDGPSNNPASLANVPLEVSKALENQPIRSKADENHEIQETSEYSEQDKTPSDTSKTLNQTPEIEAPKQKGRARKKNNKGNFEVTETPKDPVTLPENTEAPQNSSIAKKTGTKKRKTKSKPEKQTDKKGKKTYPEIILPTKDKNIVTVTTPLGESVAKENPTTLVIEDKDTTKHRLSSDQITKAKKLGIILGIVLAITVFVILMLPKFKEVLSDVLPEQEEEKPLILGDDPPVNKEEPPKANGAMLNGLKTTNPELLNISVEDSKAITLDTSGATSKIKILPENRGLSASISTAENNVSLGQTKLPEKENQFCVVETKIDEVAESKINPKRRYISIIHPDNTEKRIVVETSTKALVELLDNKTIKSGDNARITLGFLDKKMQEKYKTERQSISKKMTAEGKDFYSVEEYQIISEEKN